MTTTHVGKFATRRDAELAVERLVQEHDVDRSRLFIHPAGPQNTAGLDISGSDRSSAEPGRPARHDGALNGAVLVSVETTEEETLSKVRGAFREFGVMEE